MRTGENIRAREAQIGRSGRHERNGIETVVDSGASNHESHDVSMFETFKNIPPVAD